MGPFILLFLTSADLYSGFQSHCGYFACELSHLNSSESTLLTLWGYHGGKVFSTHALQTHPQPLMVLFLHFDAAGSIIWKLNLSVVMVFKGETIFLTIQFGKFFKGL